MRKSINKTANRNVVDENAFLHDQGLNIIDEFAVDRPRWNGSAAQRLLTLDFPEYTAGRKNGSGMLPKNLWQSRPEYQAFDLKVFRDHIGQIARSKTESGYWKMRNREGKKQRNKVAQLV